MIPDVWYSAFATIERLGKVRLIVLLRAGVPWEEANARVDAELPFPAQDAPVEDLQRLADRYPAAMQSYRDLFALVPRCP